MKSLKKIIYVMMACAYAEMYAANNPAIPNVAIAQDYLATQNVTNVITSLLSFSPSPSAPSTQATLDTNAFLKKTGQAMRDLITSVENPDYVAYLKLRDKARLNAHSPADLIGGFFNAYSEHIQTVDIANTHWQQFLAAVTSMLNYETLVTNIGEGSEVKLRERLLPIARIVARLLG